MNSIYAILVHFDTFSAVFTSRTEGFSEVTYPYLVEHGTFSSAGGSFQLDISNAPNEITDQYWGNRDIEVWLVDQNAGSIYEGNKLFEGVIRGEPSETNLTYSLSCQPPTRKVAFIPDAQPITVELYPKASADAVGKIPATVFGEAVVPMLGTKVPVVNTLNEPLFPNSYKAVLGDTTAFPDSGSVVLGDKTYSYNSKNAKELLGINVADYYPAGTQVALVGEAEYIAANHPITVSEVFAGTNAITGYQDIGGGVRFNQSPSYLKQGGVFTAQLQFDRVATGSIAQTYNIEYLEGETLKPVSLTQEPVSISTYNDTPKEISKFVTTTLIYAINTVQDLGIVNPKGNITYQYTLNDAISHQGFRLFKATCSVTKAVTIPNGVSVSISAKSSVNRGMDLYPDRDINTSLTVNGIAVSSNTTVTSSGTVTIASSTEVYFGVPFGAPTAAVSVLREALSRSTLNDAIAEINKRNFVIYSNYDYVLNTTLNWTQTVAAAPPQVPVIPSASTLPARMDSVTTTYDLTTTITAPATITAGNYTFSVVSSAPPRSDIGFTPVSLPNVYQVVLGGVPAVLPALGGVTNIVVPVTPGQVLSLTHTLNISDIPVDSQLLSLFGTNTFEKPPANTLGTSISLLIPKITSVSVTWAQGSITSPALNPGNAIRYVTNNNLTQNASFISTINSATGLGQIQFAPPSATGEGIVKGFYQVAFSVGLSNYKGPVDITIGNTLVYSSDEGIAQYEWTPATILFDDNVNVLPVKVGGDLSQFSVSITSASRLVYVGNLGGAKYATLRYPSNTRFLAVQTDENPNLGIIDKAYLAVEWFAAGRRAGVSPSVDVKFGGLSRGNLYSESPLGSAVNQTVSVGVDSNNPGRTTLTTTQLSQAVTGGTASQSHLTTQESVTVTAAFGPPILGGATRRGFTSVPKLTGWSPARGAIQAKMQLRVASGFNPTVFYFANIRDVNGTTIIQLNCSAVSWTLVATDIYESSAISFSTEPRSVYWEEPFTQPEVSILGMSMTYTASITESSIALSNTPAGGGTFPSGSPNMALTNFALVTSGGNISVTVPDSPRTMLTTFPLPDVKNWSDMTAKSVELTYGTGVSTLDINLIQVQLVVEYVEDIRIPADQDNRVTAKVYGLSANPADVISYLGRKAGFEIDSTSYNRLATWCEDNNYVFSRSITDSTEAETLLNYAAEQVNALVTIHNNTLYMVRWFDLDDQIIEIDAADLFEHPTITYVERIENDVTVKYAEDYVNAAGFTKTAIANELSNTNCRHSIQNNRVTNTITVEAGFIADTPTARLFLDEYVGRHAVLHRSVSFSLPHTYSDIRPGSLTKFLDVVYRVLNVENDGVWIQVSCEEVVT